MGIFGLSITLGSSASLGTLKMADVLSSQTWKESVNGEIKGRKAWQEKYGHQFEDDGVTPVSSRPSTGRASACSRPPSTRPQSNMSQCSDDSQARKKLIDLKAKLTAALTEVEDELSLTARGSSCSRR